MKHALPYITAFVVLATVFSASARLAMMPTNAGSGSGPTFFNIADQGGGITVSTTNYPSDTMTSSAIATWRGIRSNAATPVKTSGKWHFEIQVLRYDNGNGWQTGVMNSVDSLTSPAGFDMDGVGFQISNALGSTTMTADWSAGAAGTWSFALALSHWLAFELDLDNSKIWWQDATLATGWSAPDPFNDFSGNPATNTRGIDITGIVTTGGLMISCFSYNQNPPGSANADQCVLNPGIVTSGQAFIAAISSGFTAWDH